MAHLSVLPSSAMTSTWSGKSPKSWRTSRDLLSSHPLSARRMDPTLGFHASGYAEERWKNIRLSLIIACTRRCRLRVWLLSFAEASPGLHERESDFAITFDFPFVPIGYGMSKVSCCFASMGDRGGHAPSQSLTSLLARLKLNASWLTGTRQSSVDVDWNGVTVLLLQHAPPGLTELSHHKTSSARRDALSPF
ncbi:hypothetical protein DAEQUDRAFT_542811 [Daedalea quercina L-15889]|uniref:Uncharacterized protein n=1 Tax=Daedalea quercina L-15889 TaxID=1314783 RepID=A0A165M4D6_9APHY|nr:hypothetical protein DAEQUDRAFT_542811 [Daedalea quercina L-15889]